MQVIIGSGGSIGVQLAYALKKYTNNIRLVSRNPQKVNEDDELRVADITLKDQVYKAVEGAEVVYLTAGFEYNIAVWKNTWPVAMQNVIDACIQHSARLVFFDNVYMYSKEAIGHMSECSPIDPPSKKGRVRAELVTMLTDAMMHKGLTALIARSADFYGPHTKNSLLTIGVIDNFRKGKRAFWQSDAGKIHSMTFTPDAAKATALLGNTADAFGQVWHLPTSAEKLTGKDYIRLTAKMMQVMPRYFILNKFIIGLLGIFSPAIRELQEMQYQNDRDYFFDSSKFESRFAQKPTSYEQGILQSLL